MFKSFYVSFFFGENNIETNDDKEKEKRVRRKANKMGKQV